MDITQNKNGDARPNGSSGGAMQLLMSQLQQRFAVVAQGGGKKAIEKQREKNKLTARERIEYLRDADKPFTEIAAFAGYEMYEEYGGCPAAAPLPVSAM